MRQPVQIRVLGAEDVGPMRAMLAMFGKAFDDLPTYTAKQPSDSYLEDLLAGDNFIAVAALEDREIIGGIAGYVLPKFEQQLPR